MDAIAYFEMLVGLKSYIKDVRAKDVPIMYDSAWRRALDEQGKPLRFPEGVTALDGQKPRVPPKLRRGAPLVSSDASAGSPNKAPREGREG